MICLTASEFTYLVKRLKEHVIGVFLKYLALRPLTQGPSADRMFCGGARHDITLYAGIVSATSP